MGDIDILKDQLIASYKKLKNHIYYDNYAVIQRFELANFEFENFRNDKDIFDKDVFDRFFYKFAEDLISDFDNVISDIVNKIDVISLPKSVSNDKDSIKVISNCNKKKNNISKIHYFIDLPIEGHILSVLWIIKSGFVLDKRLYNNCYANRINDTLIDSILNNKNIFSPFLFHPYYEKYSSWRDNALNSITTLLKDNKNAIMLSLDFKDYYYRSLIDFKRLNDDIIDSKEKINVPHTDFDEKLNSFIEKVFNCYSLKFKRIFDKNNEENLPMIPLGFLPSLIIANWNLQGFDQSILEDINPFYYGRYVDDVLIVMESHEKSELHGEQHINELSLNKFIEKYLTYKHENPHNNIFKKNNSDWMLCDIHVHNNEENYYPYNNLKIQNDKLKIYKFSYKCSDVILKNFRKEIYKNSSEFRLMHGFESIIDELEDNIYQINYRESINKLNDIENVKINKFEISKILTRLNIASKNMSNTISMDIVKEILNAFNGKSLEFFSLWEKLFSFLYINNKFEELCLYCLDIINEISTISFCIKDNNSQKETFDFLLKDIDETYNIKNSLFKFLYFSLVRTFSLKSFNENNYHFKRLLTHINENTFDNYNYKKDIKMILFSLMQNNNLMKYPLQNAYMVYKNNDNYNLIKTNNGDYDEFLGIYPRFIKLHEFILYNINKELFKKNCDLNYINDSINLYYKYNFEDKGNINEIKEGCGLNVKDICNLNCNMCKKEHMSYNYACKVFNIGTDIKQRIKVGLLNTKLEEKDIADRIKKIPNLSNKRFDMLKKLINESIKKEVDLLLMPEMYIPYEWIGELVKISKDHQMAIIFGVEPIESEGYVGNYIMMAFPFIINEKYYESTLFYRLKNHYAPSEIKLLKTYGKELIRTEKDFYYLFNWNNVYIAPYYCFEITDISSRNIFKSWCDIITVSEFNKDVNYFNGIGESLSRDLFCYCIKSNTSEFGGNVIIQPSSSENKYLINLKGGDDDYVVTCNLDINILRENAIKDDVYDKENTFKPKPPGLDMTIIKKRMKLE